MAAFTYSKVRSPQYQSTALVQVAASTSASGTSGSSSASPVSLPDPVQELNSTAVQLGAARILKNPDLASLSNSVTGTVDATTGALSITATASTPQEAQAMAQAYSQSFIDQIQAVVQAQVDKISASLTTLNAKISALEQPGTTPSALVQAQISALSQTSGTLLAEQYNIQSGEPYATIQVAAALPTASTGLGKSKLLGLGFVAGLLVGIGIALVREQFDTRLRTSPDMESITTAPILAELPHDSDVRSGKIAIALVQAPQSQVAESIRELRTSLRVIFEDTPCPLIVVTSPEPGDGKTFVAANLATAWAMSGSKVIVVSADFRRPRLEEIFGLQATGLAGLADLIRTNWKNPDPDVRPVARRELSTTGSPPNERNPASSYRATPSRSRRDVGDSADPSSVKSLLVETGIWGLQVLPAGTHAGQPERALRQPGHPARARPAPAAGRRGRVRHTPGAGRARHRHPRADGQRHRGGGLGGQDRPGRPRTHHQPAGGHAVPGAGRGPQPGPSFVGRHVPVLRLQAVTTGAPALHRTGAGAAERSRRAHRTTWTPTGA